MTTAIGAGVGDYHDCAVLADGSVECWGAGGQGELGNGTMTDMSFTPVLVSDLSTAISVSSGRDQSCVVLSSGWVECWGYGDGELGNPSGDSSSTPVFVSGLGPTTDLTSLTLSGSGPAGSSFGGSPGAPTIVSATLTDVSTATPLSGRTVTFTLNGSQSCSATTGATGRAACSLTPGQAAGTYPLLAAFAGDPGDLASSTSGSVTVVAPHATGASPAPASTSPPRVSGTRRAGAKLSCSTGGWNSGPTSYTYQWYRDGTPLAGFTAPSYTLGTLDEGTTLTCVVTAINGAGHTAATSGAVKIPIPYVAKCPGADRHDDRHPDRTDPARHDPRPRALPLPPALQPRPTV